MYWFTIKNNVITNYISSSSAFASGQVSAGIYDQVIDASTVSGTRPDIGWTYSAGAFTPPAAVSSTYTLSGTTSGAIQWAQTDSPIDGKRFAAAVNSYVNTSATNQSITFAIPFTNAPIITGNNTGLALSATTTTLTITSPQSAAAFSGNVVVEGF